MYLTSRLCLCFEDLEDYHGIEQKRVKAMTLQKMTFVRLNIERIFVDEVLKLLPKMRQPALISNNIANKLGLPID